MKTNIIKNTIMETIFGTRKSACSCHSISALGVLGKMKGLGLAACLLVAGCMQMWGAVYELVTDASTLSAGDVILIVSEGRTVTTKISGTNYTATYSDQAMNKTTVSNRLQGDDVSISSSSITSTTATEFTLSGNSSGWKIYNGTDYLYTEARNKLTTSTEANGLAFTIEINSTTGVATITTVKNDFDLGSSTYGSLVMRMYGASNNTNTAVKYFVLYAASNTTSNYDVFVYKKCSNIVTINKGTATNCTFSLGTSGAQASCGGVSTTVTVTPNTGYGSPSVTQSGASAAPTITGSGNNWTVAYGANTTGTSTINVSCSAKTTTVSFNQNGGSGGQTGTKTATYGQAMPTPITLPTREHYDFGGYYDGAGGTGTQYYTSTGASAQTWNKDAATATLYAKWTEHALTNYRTNCGYSITYNCNGASSGCPADAEQMFNLPNPLPSTQTKTGYDFAGWYTNEGLTDAAVAGAEINDDVTLYAKWTAKTYTTSNNLDKNGGDANGQYTATYDATSIAINTTPTRAGYTIEGYYKEAGCTNKVATAAGALQANKTYTDGSSKWIYTSAPTLFTKWTETTHTVSVAVGANGSSVSPTSVSGVGITTTSGDITATPNTGYHFVNWTLPSGVTAASTYSATSNPIRINATADGKTITANFAPNDNTAYTVKHYKQKLDGTYPASADDTDNLTGTTGASVTPDRKSYTGFTAPAGQTVTILADGSRVVEYKYTRNSYTLTWSTDGDPLSGSYTNGSTKYGATITAPNTPTKANYVFAAWSPTPAATMPAANTTYTATWTAAVASVTAGGSTTYYTTLAGAMGDAMLSDNSTIKILDDISGQTALTYNVAKKCTLDLNNHTVAGTVDKLLTINDASANFTITDSSVGKSGVLKTEVSANARVYCLYITAGKVNLKNGKVYCKNTHTYSSATENKSTAVSAIYVTAGQTFIMDNGTVESEAQYGSYALYIAQGTSTITVNGGLIKGHTNKSTTASGIYNLAKGLTINNGHIIGHAYTSTSYGLYLNGGHATVNGGTIEATNDTTSNKGATTAYGIYVAYNSSSYKGVLTIPSSSTVNVLAKARTTTAGAVNIGGGSTGSTIEGGTFTAWTKTSTTAYGIYSSGNITVSGGTFNVNSYGNIAYGIYSLRGKVTINGTPTFNVKSGGTTAYGAFAYGTIGKKGTGKYSGTIEVNSGTFNVTSTTTTAYGAYAGLASRNLTSCSATNDTVPGMHYMPGIIDIKGGTFNVTATTTGAYGIVVAAAKSESGTVGTTTRIPLGTITGGKFYVQSSGDANATAYAMNSSTTAARLVVEGGYYSTDKTNAASNPTIGGKYTAPTKSCNYRVFAVSPASEGKYNYKVAQFYTITYNKGSNGTGTVDPGYKAIGDDITITSSTFTRTGYTQTAWNTNSAGTGGTNYAFGATYSTDADLTLYPTWTANTYTVTFDKEGGSGGSSSVTATYDAAMPSITAPTKTGYTFGGYWDGDGGTGTQYYNANGTSARTWNKASNTTLYAKWTAKTITITWNPNGEGATVSPTSSSYTYDGSTVTLPTPTRPLSVFTGWYTEESGGTEITEVGTTNKPTEDVTYYAHWRVLSFEVKDQAGTGTADIHLTSTRGVTVYATSGCGNLITIKGSNLDAIGNKQNIQIKYLDANNGDALVDKANSPFRLCNNGSSNYNNADGGNINLNGLTNYSQTYSISYTPSEYGKIDHYKLQLRLQNNNTNAITITFDLYGRSLPDEFVIAAKYADDGKWYALPNTLGTTSSASAPTPTEITVDNATSPTRAMNVPSSLIYKACDRYKNSPNTQFASIRFSSDGSNHMQASTSATAYQLWLAPSGTNAVAQNWYLNSSDFSSYLVQLDPANSNSKKLGFYNSSGIKMGFHGTAPKGCDIYFLSTGEEYEAEVQAWTEHDMLVELESSITSNSVTATLNGTTVAGIATGSGTTYIVHTEGLNYADKSGKELVIRWKNSNTILGTTKIEMPNVIAVEAGNWPTSSAPTIDDYVVLKGATTVTVTNAKAKDVVLDKSGDNSGSLTINAGKELVVAQKVHVFNGSSFGATGADDLVFGSTSALGLGALVMGNHDGTNKATVNFYTRSKGDKHDNTSVGQYVGTPFSDETNILYNWYNSWVYKIIYNSGVIGWDRVNEGQGMDPFKGYCVFSADAWDNDAGHSYWMQGTLVTSANHTCSGLNWKSGSGTANLNNENLLANSWMAPIKIKAMQTSDFTNAEATIYIFNSTSSSAYEDLAGNYDTYTVNVSEAVIPAMQSFSVFTKGSSASVTLDYNRIVYAPALAGTATPIANKAPQRAGASEDEADKMRLFVRTEDGYGDMLYMWEREDFEEGFENGWDGHKLFGESYAPQLYAITPDGEMAVNCVPSWEGTVLGFKKGTEDNVYTFTFEYEGEQTWYLNDLKAEESTRIMSGNTYAFSTADGDSEARFIISATPIRFVPTAIENGEAAASSVRKLLINDHVYIIRHGRMYDATGVMVK